jgi:hypothetical protein
VEPLGSSEFANLIPKIDHGLSQLKIGRSEWPRDPINKPARWSYRWDDFNAPSAARAGNPRPMEAHTVRHSDRPLWQARMVRGDRICPHHLIEAYVLSEKIARLNFPSAAIQSIIPW